MIAIAIILIIILIILIIRPTRDLAPPSEGSADDCGVMCTFLKELLEGHLKVDMVVPMMMMTDSYCDNDDCGVMSTFLNELHEGHLNEGEYYYDDFE